MLYQLYDWQRAAMQPWRALAQAANELYGHPDSPLAYLPGNALRVRAKVVGDIGIMQERDHARQVSHQHA